MKSPAFQFYPGDWRRDLPLRYCSLEARGLWIELMCLMHDGTPYGHLATEHEPITDPVLIAKMVGAPVGRVRRALEELTRSGVLSTTDNGVIYSRRMVRDADLNQRRASYGHLGKDSGHLGKEYGKLGGRPKKTPVDVGIETPLDAGIPKPRPASAPAPASALEPRTTLSGWRPTALRCLEFLNEKTGRTYQPVRANLSLLEARLKEGATEANIRGVIARKVRQWQGDPKMAEYLRPKTLFNATNFAQYLGERAPEAGHGLPPVQ